MRKMWLCTVTKDGQELDRQIFISTEEAEQWFRNTCREYSIDPDMNPMDVQIGKTLSYIYGTIYAYLDPDDEHLEIFARQEYVD